MGRKTIEAHKIDLNVGAKIKELRQLNGLTRSSLAAKISVTQQQLEKYEKGINRISSGRLFNIANALGKPVSYFFEEELIEDSEGRTLDMKGARAFMSIQDLELKKTILALMYRIIK